MPEKLQTAQDHLPILQQARRVKRTKLYKLLGECAPFEDFNGIRINLDALDVVIKLLESEPMPSELPPD